MDVKELTVTVGDNLKKALEVLDATAFGIIFITDKDSHLNGILTDGDIRRALLKNFTLETTVDDIMNSDFISLPIGTDNSIILEHINNKIKIIPLVDDQNKLIDFASIHKIRRIVVAAPVLTGNELAYVTDCIKTNWISSQGKYVRQFEELFSSYHENVRALAVCNGTVALHLALAALDIGKGDEVIVSNLTFAASVNAILYTGATPVLADADPITWNIDSTKIKALITSKTKAIMPVHLYGLPCNMDEIMQIATEHKLLVIEDCAEALGSLYKNRPVGVLGDAATFSFYGNKTITTGEGGMVLFRKESVAERAAVLRDHGMQKTKRYWHTEIGFNYRLTNLQAAIGVAQFERLNEFVTAKRNIAHTYNKAFDSIPYFQLPAENEYSKNSYWLYTMLIKRDSPFGRDELIEYLLAQGVETRRVFYTMQEMPPYKSFGKAGNLLQSKGISECGISLPSSVNIEDTELAHVCITIQSFVKKFLFKN